MLAEILNVVQVFTPAHAVTVCYCCYCCSAASKQKTAKNPGKTRKYLGFPGYFRVLPALDAGDRRGSLPGLPYCCSAGLTLATVVGEPHCCSVVTVNTSNTVQLPTLNSSTHGDTPTARRGERRRRPHWRHLERILPCRSKTHTCTSVPPRPPLHPQCHAQTLKHTSPAPRDKHNKITAGAERATLLIW